MKIYELIYIVSPEITSEDAEAKGKEIETFIQSKEGTILKQTNATAKALSYPIKNRASGFLGVLEFQVEEDKLADLKDFLNKDGKVVRHMITIKRAGQLKKERRTRNAVHAPKEEAVAEPIEPKISHAKPAEKPEAKEKVELKDIEEKLEEILGE